MILIKKVTNFLPKICIGFRTELCCTLKNNNRSASNRLGLSYYLVAVFYFRMGLSVIGKNANIINKIELLYAHCKFIFNNEVVSKYLVASNVFCFFVFLFFRNHHLFMTLNLQSRKKSIQMFCFEKARI